MGIGDILNMQKFIPTRKSSGEFPEWIALNVFELDIEMNPFRIFRSSSYWDIPFANHIGKVCIVAGMGT